MPKTKDKPGIMSNEPTIDAINMAIAVFMGWEFIKGDPTHKCNFCFAGDEPCTPALDRFVKDNDMRVYYEFKYHSSWDWLMPVVSKIEMIENGRFGFTVDPWGIEIIDYKECYEGKTEVAIVNVTREFEKGMNKDEYLKSVYYEAVTDFLQCYNKQSTTTNEQA